MPAKTRPALLVCCYGLGAGLSAVAFQQGINAVYHLGIVQLSHLSPLGFALGSLLLIVIASLTVGYLLTTFAPEASGSGIPQLKIAFWKDFGWVPWRVVWVKYIAGVLSVGSGCSLGREGPSVQLAGGLASNLAGLFGVAKQQRRLAAAAGAAAGLAAAFNTPLAAVTFVLEEIIDDLNSSLLGGVLLASVIGAFVVHGLIGRQPAFTVTGIDSPTWFVYCLTPIVAAVAGLVGVQFQRWTVALRGARKQFQSIPAWLRPTLGGAITWAIGCAVFFSTGHLGVFSLGYDDLSSGLAHQLAWQLAAVLLAAKLLATIACYGLGGCGGIFSPTLFFGGMCGILLAGIGNLLLPLSPPDQLTLTVVGMSACLGAVVRAPVTGILIVFEMTHEFSLVPALMIGALVSQAISRKLNQHSFYEAVLVQDGHHLDRVIPPRDLQGWQQLPASAIANFHPVLAQKDASPNQWRALLRDHPYERFPVVSQGSLSGVISRKEIQSILATPRPIALEKAVTCLPNETISELQLRLIESPATLLVMVDRPGGQPLGLITLHDLLRAQTSFSRGDTG
jgi:CIC family chloride channel protein